MYALHTLETWNIAIFELMRGSPSTSRFMTVVAAWLAEAPAVIAGCVALWYVIKRRSMRTVLSIALGLIVAKVIESIIANHAYHPRPFAAGFGPSLVAHAANNSMPSSHVTFVLFLCFYFSLKREWYLAITLFVLASVLAWARVFVGIHWPLDMVGSALSASICALIAYAMQKLPFIPENGWPRPPRSTRPRSSSSRL